MVVVGLIVNPAASRDVRRLTSLARTVDVHERVNTVARILRGLAAAGVDEIRYMAEPCRVVERSIEELASAGALGAGELLRMSPIDLPDRDEADDARGTALAAAALAGSDVGVVVTVGGDGTNRAVALGWPGAVLLPLPGGTNNAFAAPVDPTAAGLAAGLYAADPAGLAGHVRPRVRLEVFLDGRLVSIALVDVAVVRGGWVGAHAIWEPELLEEAIVASSDPSLTGLAGVGGMVCPLDPSESRALHLRFGSPGRLIGAPLGPGQLVPLSLRGWSSLRVGETVVLRDPDGAGAVGGGDGETRRMPGNVAFGPATIAFDGEREIVLRAVDRVEVRLDAGGPRVLDAAGLLRQVAADGLAVSDSGGIRRPPAAAGR